MDEGPLTRVRRERKTLFEADEAARLERELRERFSCEEPPQTRITSVYFDHADGRLAALALANPRRCLKVRTKEYHPDWGEPVEPRCVVEIKRSSGLISRKRRVWLSRSQLAAVFGAGRVPRGSPLAAARSALRVAGGATRLTPIVAVSYRRRIYAVEQGLRVTIDRELCYLRAARELFLGAEALTPERLPLPFAHEARVVVEIKSATDVLPEWARPFFDAGRGGFSKFASAVRRLAPPAAPPAEPGLAGALG